MNTLDLPPRRPLPRETRDRMRRTIDTGTMGPPRRSRAPLAAAAAAAVVLGAAVAFVSTSVTRDDQPVATPPDTEFQAPTMAMAGSHTEEDLDRCADVATASPRAADFAPRRQWHPRFTAALPGGTRVTAFVSAGGTPSFCEVTVTTATVSDPKADWVPMAGTSAAERPASVEGVFLSPAGALAGVADGVTALEFSIVRDGGRVVPLAVPTLRQGLFVVDLGAYRDKDAVQVVGRNSQGLSVVEGWLDLSPADRPAPGVTG
jgi:hypothetical protein